MAALPPRGNLDGSTAGLTTGMFQAAIGDFRDFVAGLFGTTGAKADAQKTLGVAVVDRAYAELPGANTFVATIPIDNTVPQSSEGTQLFSLSLTPKATTNRLRARFQCPCSTSFSTAGGLDFAIAALFLNGAASASAAVSQALAADGSIESLVLEFEWVPGTLAAQTVALRVGCANGNFILGGNRFGAVLAGVVRSTLVLEEITA